MSPEEWISPPECEQCETCTSIPYYSSFHNSSRMLDNNKTTCETSARQLIIVMGNSLQLHAIAITSNATTCSPANNVSVLAFPDCHSGSTCLGSVCIPLAEMDGTNDGLLLCKYLCNYKASRLNVRHIAIKMGKPTKVCEIQLD